MSCGLQLTSRESLVIVISPFSTRTQSTSGALQSTANLKKVGPQTSGERTTQKLGFAHSFGALDVVAFSKFKLSKRSSDQKNVHSRGLEGTKTAAAAAAAATDDRRRRVASRDALFHF